jgi:Protein of unknown function (DUF3237)
MRIALSLLAAVAGAALMAAEHAQPSQPAQPRTASSATAPAPPRLTLAMELRVTVGAPLEVGNVPRGRRRIIPIEGGTFEGPNLRGAVLPGGADWQIVRADGLAELDTRYTLKTDAGDVIYIQNAGMRHAPPEITKQLLAGQDVDPSLVYFRTVPTFETQAPHLQWLTRAIFVGTGERHPNDVIVRVWKVE